MKPRTLHELFRRRRNHRRASPALIARRLRVTGGGTALGGAKPAKAKVIDR